MPDLVEVAALSDCASKSAYVVILADEAIALFNIDGRIFAIGDSCLRCGASIGAGTLHGSEAKCSRCDWRYDVTTGAVAGIPTLRADTFDVQIVDGAVMLARPPPALTERGAAPEPRISTRRG
jgi:nitrite reductase/ring-hydroxylating ferredoxin subunit